MPVAKTPFIRYRIINQCLTNKHKPFPTLREIRAELARYDVEVQSRQLERDLETMRYDDRLGYYAPIEYCRKYRGYYYKDPDYSIDKPGLTPAELTAFEACLRALRGFKDVAMLRLVEGLFNKLDKLILPYKTKKTGRAPRSRGLNVYAKISGRCRKNPWRSVRRNYKRGPLAPPRDKGL